MPNLVGRVSVFIQVSSDGGLWCTCLSLGSLKKFKDYSTNHCCESKWANNQMEYGWGIAREGTWAALGMSVGHKSCGSRKSRCQRTAAAVWNGAVERWCSKTVFWQKEEEKFYMRVSYLNISIKQCTRCQIELNIAQTLLWKCQDGS